MAGALTASIAAAFAGSAVAATDPYFNLTTLLLSTTATNGQQNNTFLDSSSNNFTITRNPATGPNAPTQGTFSPFSQTGWGGAFNTSTTYLTVTDTANLRFGSGNFTIEAWVYRTASGATQTIASKGASTPTGWVFQISSADKLVFTDTSTSITGATSIAANTWTYVAVVRAGTGSNQTTLYVNGTSDGTGTSATTFNQTNNMLIGADRSTTNFANGYISNLRLSNTNRTISSTPTTALTADANTIFLSLNINRYQYTDSTAAFTNISVTGTPSVVPFSPFNPTSAWSASTVGGSGYFDGNADYLTAPDNAALDLGNSDFTIEGWMYMPSAPSSSQIVGLVSKWGALGQRSWQIYFYNNGGTYQIYFTYTTNGSTSQNLYNQGFTFPAGQWAHVAVVRSTTTVKFYINGSIAGTGVENISTNTVFDSTSALAVASESSTGSNYLTGYISNLRIVKGTAVYTGNFTPPTAPITNAGSTSAASYPSTNNVNTSFASSATSLLLNFTNAGIYDATSKNDLETVGNAQVSTTQSKWSPTSMYFDGTGDYLQSVAKDLFAFGTGDYTVETWVYFTSINSTTLQIIFMSGSTGGNNFYCHVDSDQISVGTTAAFISNQPSSFSTGIWYHIAFCRASGTLRLFKDGVQQGSSVTDSTNWISAGNARCGANESGTQTLFGYLQDLRITKYARYTANFTPPTAAFSVQ